MGVLDDNPIFLWFVDAVFLVSGGQGGFALGQRARIGIALQDALHRALIPTLVGGLVCGEIDFPGSPVYSRGIDSFSIETIRNRSVLLRLREGLVNHADDRGSLLIRHQHASFALPFCPVSVGRRTAHVRAFLPPPFQLYFGFLRKILGIHVIYQVLDLRRHLPVFIAGAPSVISVRHSDKAHAQKGKNLLDIISGFQIVSPEAA